MTVCLEFLIRKLSVEPSVLEILSWGRYWHAIALSSDGVRSAGKRGRGVLDIKKPARYKPLSNTATVAVGRESWCFRCVRGFPPSLVSAWFRRLPERLGGGSGPCKQPEFKDNSEMSSS